MKRPLISVAMCTCNGARFLGAQLESIARQTTAPDELVICDDFSADGTAEIVAEFAAGSPLPVRVVRNSATLGCTRNFSHAIELCRGDIIVLADQDDIWKPGKLACMAEAFAGNTGAAYVFSDAQMIDESGEQLGFSLWQTAGFEPEKFAPVRQLAMLLRRNLVTGAAMAFRSWLRGIVLPIPEEWRHDYWIALLGSLFSFGVPLPEPLFLYRRHLGQQMGCGHDSFLAKMRTSLAAEPNYYAKAARIAELRKRAETGARSANCLPQQLRLIQEKQLHLSRRALIRSARGGARLAQLVSEASSGRYQRFSYSWGSIIRDLTAVAPFR